MVLPVCFPVPLHLHLNHSFGSFGIFVAREKLGVVRVGPTCSGSAGGVGVDCTGALLADPPPVVDMKATPTNSTDGGSSDDSRDPSLRTPLAVRIGRGSLKSMSSQPLGKVSISDFAVMGKIGEGGYGTVLLGKHKASSSVVALKMLLKDSIKSEMQAERVLGEAQALSEVSHPFIVSMRGAFQDETHIFFVLEYVGGGDVFSRLHDNGPLTLDSGRTLCAEVALALGHLHERGYMYRDLKSENVLVCIDGHVKLTDFGLAKKVVDKRVGSIRNF